MTRVKSILLRDVRRLRLEPGDIIVLRIPGRITHAQRDWLQTRLAGELKGHRILVLEDGAEIEILHEDEAA